MFSVYHFFKSLIPHKHFFLNDKKLEDFSFDLSLISCKSIGKFPDLAIRLNPENELFSGGELIELKDSRSYTVSSFNSTIPTGKKSITEIITSDRSSIGKQMQEAGDDLAQLPIRDVFYLIRGRNKKRQAKVCLVHGSFFETLTKEELIASSFEQIVKERMEQTGESFSDEVIKKMIGVFSTQGSFSKVRNIDKASVKLRFRIMTEVKAQGNILSSKQYPEIRDNTLNLVLPCQDSTQEKTIQTKLNLVFDPNELEFLNHFKLKHQLNGYFYVLQTNI